MSKSTRTAKRKTPIQWRKAISAMRRLIKNPEATTIRKAIHDKCQAMGEWTVVPSDKLLAGITAHLTHAAVTGEEIQRCDATYLILDHDEMQARCRLVLVLVLAAAEQLPTRTPRKLGFALSPSVELSPCVSC